MSRRRQAHLEPLGSNGRRLSRALRLKGARSQARERERALALAAAHVPSTGGETELERRLKMDTELKASAVRVAEILRRHEASKAGEEVPRSDLLRLLEDHETTQGVVLRSLHDLGTWNRTVAASRLVETADAERELSAVSTSLSAAWALFGEVGKSSAKCVELMKQTVAKSNETMSTVRGETEKATTAFNLASVERERLEDRKFRALSAELDRVTEKAKLTQDLLQQAEAKAVGLGYQVSQAQEKATAERVLFEEELKRLERCLAEAHVKDREAHLAWRDPDAAKMVHAAAGGSSGGGGSSKGDSGEAALRRKAREATFRA